MQSTNQLVMGVLFVITSSLMAAEQPLESGYLKWLLHLGQNPTDRIHGAYGHPRIDLGPDLKPAPGQIVYLGDDCCGPDRRPATHDLMIWTPQFSATGIFANEGYDDWFTQYYHIYIHSPDERLARLHFRKLETMTVWNNGEKICQVGDIGWQQERHVDFALRSGANSMTFKLSGPVYGSPEGSHMTVRITDRNDTEFSDLTYSLEPPLPDSGTYVVRYLPDDYDPGSTIEVELQASISHTSRNGIHIIEYIPPGTFVVDPGEGEVVHNTLWWTVMPGEEIPKRFRYALTVPQGRENAISFVGYLCEDKVFAEIGGEAVLFQEYPVSPADMAHPVQTIEFFPEQYSEAQGITIGDATPEDASGSLVGYGEGLVHGLKPHPSGGWVDYELSVANPGQYQIILDYGELWTMYHHSTTLQVAIDGNLCLETQLFPTTHSYVMGGHAVWDRVSDPERKALWSAGSVHLSQGQHTLRLVFPPFRFRNETLDQYTDGRPVVTRIIVTNYPGLTVPGLARPHHLDSYEHPPAMIVHDGEVTEFGNGRFELTYHGTFYSLSQGNELYYANPSLCPKPGVHASQFEIVSMEPEVFHLPPEGEQDFLLTVRSKESIPNDYAELVQLWLQGVPANPARKPYLFSTCRQYASLPPWEHAQSFWMVGWLSWFVRRDILDPPNAFLPSREDLGFNRGRYTKGPVDHLKDQLLVVLSNFIKGF
jgi:hypothetical protein